MTSQEAPADLPERVHLVGIGGAGLSAIARLLLARGVEVSGSDGADTATLGALRALGATVHVGHDPRHLDHLRNGDAVVISTAVKADNPELVAAADRHLRVLSRGAAMAALMTGRRVVAVAGTHGKTTTTSLLTSALQAAEGDSPAANPSLTTRGFPVVIPRAAVTGCCPKPVAVSRLAG